MSPRRFLPFHVECALKIGGLRNLFAAVRIQHVEYPIRTILEHTGMMLLGLWILSGIALQVSPRLQRFLDKRGSHGWVWTPHKPDLAPWRVHVAPLTVSDAPHPKTLNPHPGRPSLLDN